MRNKFILIGLIGFLGICIQGCEDYLSVDPPFAQDADNYFASRGDYELALVGAYDLLQASFLNLWIGEIASDNSIAGGESASDTEGLHEIDEMNHDAVNTELRNVFRWNYAGITRTNFILQAQDNIDFEGKSQILGETRFLRAYYYFQLVKYFGDVPLIIDERLGVEELTDVELADKEEVYAQIENDLKFASANLPWFNAEQGRITKGAAMSLLGKVYLYQNKFSSSANVLDSVINEGVYTLLADYGSLWLLENENNSETVFDIEYSGQEGGGYDCFICLEGNPAAGFNGIRLYDGPLYADGNSYNLPTANLYEAFDTSDIRRDLSILDLDAFIARQTNPSGITYLKGAGGHTGYYNNKYIKRKNELGLPDDDLTSPLNFKVIRYADVLLMSAEAHARGGLNEGRAQSLLNEVRSRVNMPSVTSGGQALVDAIWLERRFEFSGEGNRFFDLVRTGQAQNQIEGFVNGKHEVFPLPQVEIDLAGGNWAQNDNY